MAQQRNPYQHDVDFAALALKDKDFSKVLKPNGQLDFTNPESVKQLTKSLLRRDFGLEVDLPDDRLCPPVPNRLNYVLWLQDLLDNTSPTFRDSYDEKREVVGLDMYHSGTGASCIYPLLACAQRPGWRFVATDVDSKNVQYARKNVQLNRLENRIAVVEAEASDPLIQLDKSGMESIDFTMCNPPFYTSLNEMMELAKAKSRPPNSACTGAPVEMVTEGGEVGFVQRLIDESARLGKQVQWFSSMVGKLGSLEALIPVLQERGVRNWAVTEFVQGNKTRRWGLAWSWHELRPVSKLSRSVGSLPKALLPFPPEFSVSLPGVAIDKAESEVGTLMESLDLRWQYKPAARQGIGFANGNVWSRAARRSKQRQMDLASDGPQESSDAEQEPALGFKASLTDRDGTTTVEVRWLMGNDSVLYESFCGMLRRKLTS